MKKNIIYRFIAAFFVATIIIAACTKEGNDVRLDPKLSTSQVLNLKSDSVTVIGFVISQGDGFNEKGVCFSTDPAPTTDDNKVIYTGDTKSATYPVNLKVSRLTKYYVRAYAVNSAGTIYGDEFSFTTPAALPKLANISASVIGNTTDKGVTATTDINITDDGGPHTTADITKRGVVYGLKPNVSLDSVSSKVLANRTFVSTEGVGKGQFTSLVTKLNGNVKYYLKAYATNTIGTAYSNEVSFTTPVGYPFATTSAAANITKATATLKGVVTSNGGGTITEKGFVYGLAANPTVADNKIIVSSNKDSISADVTGLTVTTTYHVRTFVTNEKGTNYGEDVTFLTLADITKFWIVGDATANGWNNDDKAPFIISTATNNGAAEGYVYLKVGEFKLTTDHSWDNAHTFGDDGSGKLTNPGANIKVTSDGYYLLKASLNTMTYSLTKTSWGVIGDATADAWNSDQNMTFSPTLNRWFATIPLTAGAIKFRANDDWPINYGDTGNNGSLEAGGDNIPVTAGTWTVILDLSTPWNYTYSVTKWGLVGSATGSWDVDKDMTSHPDNTWTITTDLTVGEIKFRANDAWAVNYGGSAGKIVAGGDNIAISTAGNYTIKLDFVNGTYTITKN